MTRDALTIRTASGEFKRLIPAKITGVQASDFSHYCAVVYHGYNHAADVQLDAQETREAIRSLPLQGCKYRNPSVRQCWGMRQQYDGPPSDCWRCQLTDIYYRQGHGDLRIPDVPEDKPSCVFYAGIIGIVLWASVSVCHGFAAEDTAKVAVYQLRAEQARRQRAEAELLKLRGVVTFRRKGGGGRGRR